MKKILTMMAMLCLCHCVLAQKSRTDISFIVKDQQTGFAIPGATVTVTAPDGKTTTLQSSQNGKVSFSAVDGKYAFIINAPDHKSLETFFSSGDESAIEANINLDPITTPVETLGKDQRNQNAIQITGYVHDADENTPLAGVQVSAGDNSATTNDKGFFVLQLAAPASDLSNGKIPSTLTVRSSKTGYVAYSMKNYAIPGNYTLKIGLTANTSPRLQKARISTEETESTPHGLFDRTEADDQKRYADNPASNNNARSAAIAAAVPGSIRVGTGCSCHDCGSVQVMSLEAYTESGLDEEWIASWKPASLQAGAVAYRSYGAWYVQHPVRANYDISSTTCAQVWASDVVASTRDAARATAGIVLLKDGAIFRSEYSAENNNAGCGNGWSGTGSTWPCISDARCAGRAKNGHGRGMCQWGSSFWASDQSYLWILNHYYNPGGVFVEQPYVLIPNGTYRITHAITGKVLDAMGCSGNNGTLPNIWDWYGADCQRWSFEHTGDGWYKITCRLGGRALDNDRCLPNDGNKIQLWDWLDNDCQRWRIQDWGNGILRIVNKSSGKLLDVSNDGRVNGSVVFQWSATGANAQRWTLQPVSANYIADGTYRIRLARNNKVLQPAAGNDTRGIAMSKSDWLDSSYQKWRIENTPDGWYKFSSPNGFAMDVENCNATEGGKVMLWDWLNNDCQRWSLSAIGNGQYNIVSKASGKALDAPSDNEYGDLVYQWTWINNENQQWIIEAPPASVARKVSTNQLSLSPNPVTPGAQVQLIYNSDVAQPASITVTDIYGRPVQQRLVSVQKGINRFVITTSSLKTGVYNATIQLSDNSDRSSKKIIVK